MLKTLARYIAALALALAGTWSGAAQWMIETGDLKLHVFNMSAAEFKRVSEPSCKMFSDEDGHRLVQSDRVRALGTSKSPTWESAATCSRTYCLETPAWHWKGDAVSGANLKNSCFVLSMSSTYKFICTRGYSEACNQRRHYLEIKPATSTGPDQEPFTPIAGQVNELESARYKVTLQKSGAMIIADKGTSYRSKP